MPWIPPYLYLLFCLIFFLAIHVKLFNIESFSPGESVLVSTSEIIWKFAKYWSKMPCFSLLWSPDTFRVTHLTLWPGNKKAGCEISSMSICGTTELFVCTALAFICDITCDIDGPSVNISFLITHDTNELSIKTSFTAVLCSLYSFSTPCKSLRRHCNFNTFFATMLILWHL